MNKFVYKVSGLKGSVVYTDFQSEVEITIEAKKISEATDKIRQYFADNFLQANQIVLIKIAL
ncbi:MAG: hypothetical protein V4438_04345 [Patescibacteria group bacterium]